MARIIGFYVWQNAEDDAVLYCRECYVSRPMCEENIEAVRYGSPDAQQSCAECSGDLQEIAVAFELASMTVAGRLTLGRE